MTENPKPSIVTQSLNALTSLIHKKNGPMTQELLQAPSAFGLGRLPAGVRPDATTTMVCGYCSTGCGLNVHLKLEQPAVGTKSGEVNGKGPRYLPVGITPATRLPGQFGHGMSQRLGSVDTRSKHPFARRTRC